MPFIRGNPKPVEEQPTIELGGTPLASFVDALRKMELSSIFSPSQASAEVIPEDFASRKLIQDTLKAGGKAADTLRTAQEIPQKATLSASQPAWDATYKPIIEKTFPLADDVKNRQQYLEGYRDQALGNFNFSFKRDSANQITGLDTSQRADKGPSIRINPRYNTQEGGQAATLAHEVGHFLVTTLGFYSRLKNDGIDEEHFSDYLAGLKPGNEKMRQAEKELKEKAKAQSSKGPLSFEDWKKKYAPTDSGEDYDLRGAYEAGITPNADNGHFPDTFKKPNHPTFSIESKYYKPGLPAGRWEGEKYIKMSAEEAAAWVKKNAPKTLLQRFMQGN